MIGEKNRIQPDKDTMFRNFRCHDKSRQSTQDPAKPRPWLPMYPPLQGKTFAPIFQAHGFNVLFYMLPWMFKECCRFHWSVCPKVNDPSNLIPLQDIARR